ncbi:MAG: MBL fold metallo-hydrolase [Gallionellaceae bacterium]|nr:MBL fold metallo-hydrolase [Gallionellaceae bacterium]
MTTLSSAPAPVVLFDNGDHKCISFTSLVKGDGVQANQFLVIHNGHGAVIDPGGDLTFTPLTIELFRHIKRENLDYVLASHQDPDIIASLPHWLMHTPATAVASKLWARFMPHLASPFIAQQIGIGVTHRLLELPDQGASLRFGDSVIKAIPAHFLHSVGNFQFYDPISRILFSGDMGASITDLAHLPVTDFNAHIPAMIGFHQRYMCSRRVTRLWAQMVRGMDVEMIVPQHGRPFIGAEMVARFLNWISDLECGVDLMTQENYRCPK